MSGLFMYFNVTFDKKDKKSTTNKKEIIVTITLLFEQTPKKISLLKIKNFQEDYIIFSGFSIIYFGYK
jgi:hypothetical protein